MGYEVIDLEEVDPLPNRTATGLEISNHYVPPDGLDDLDEKDENNTRKGPEKIGLRLYEVSPGEALGKRYHYHEEQEEIFYVIEGTIDVKTPEKKYHVNAGQAFVVEPGSPQRTFNPESADESVRVIAIGAPSYSILGRNDAKEYDPATES